MNCGGHADTGCWESDKVDTRTCGTIRHRSIAVAHDVAFMQQ